MSPELSESCARCFQRFFWTPDDTVVAMMGRDIRPELCDGCEAARPVSTPHDKRTRRAADTSAREAKRAAEWLAMTGPYFARFDVQLLPPVMWPHVEPALTWMPDSHKGVSFIGDTYTGKSRVIHELGRQLYMEGHDVFATSGVEFGRKVISQLHDRDGWSRYLHRCENCAILLLDDADKLKLTDAVEAEYYGMLETRRRWLRPVLATLNVSGETIAAGGSANRGGPIATRLRDLCDFTVIA